MKKVFILISLFISSHSFGQIPQDKLLHFGAGVGIGATVNYPTTKYGKASEI